MFAGLFAKLALGALWSRAKTNAVNDWHAVPPKARLWMIAAVALVAAFFIHQHVAHVKMAHRLADGFKAGYAKAVADDKAAIDKMRAAKTKAEQDGAAAANALKEAHNAKVTSVSSAVADLVRDGPGKARCGRIDYPGLATLPSGQVTTSGTGTPAVDPVPAGGGPVLIAVPFTDFVRLSGQCDIIRDEVAKARMNDDQQRAIWDRYRKSLAH
jgi:hypothetical protein